jgi:hypothetical protein
VNKTPLFDLVHRWRQRAEGCMKMAQMHSKAGWACKRGSKEEREHESDRYRWFRVAETYRYCAKELCRSLKTEGKRKARKP